MKDPFEEPHVWDDGYADYRMRSWATAVNFLLMAMFGAAVIYAVVANVIHAFSK